MFDCVILCVYHFVELTRAVIFLQFEYCLQTVPFSFNLHGNGVGLSGGIHMCHSCIIMLNLLADSA